MGLDARYNDKFDSLVAFTQTTGQAAKTDARRLWNQGSHTKSLYLIGMADWYLEAKGVIEGVKNALNDNPQTLPDTWANTRDRKDERIEHMREIVRTLSNNLKLYGPFIPKTTGEASPAIALWNEGNLVPAVYMAGRWKAARSVWDVLHASWGWSGESYADKGLDWREAPFPGDEA